MSTKSSVFYWSGPNDGLTDVFHVYYDMGIHQPAGYYIDFRFDEGDFRVRIPEELAEKFKDADKEPHPNAE